MPVSHEAAKRRVMRPHSGPACIARAPALFVLAVALAASGRARADGAYAPIGTDVLLQGRPAEGLIVLHSGYTNSPLIDADVLVFVGADSSGASGDVLDVSLSIREPNGWGRARLGRFILSTGAVRPVQMDGVSLLGRTPSGETLEVFGGMPVVPEFGPRSFDWLAGARVGQWLWSERLGLGVSYVQQRDAAETAREEIGTDLSTSPLAWLSLNAIGAWDLVSSGLAEATLRANAHDEDVQLQLFASRRVAARLLPATSLFSVISNAPTSEVGSDASFTAFPRLDVGGTLALEGLDGDYGYRVAVRSTLRLSDEGNADVRAEATRRELGGQGYSGCALTTRVPLVRRLQGSASLELVAPDHPQGGGALWPWARVGATYAPAERWTVAAAIGAKATPEIRREIYGLLRVSYFDQVVP
jgi:hypothetical protein